MSQPTQGCPKGSHGLSRYEEMVDDIGAFWAASQRPIPTCIWVNPLKAHASPLLALLQARGLDVEPVDWCAGGLRCRRWPSPGNTIPYRMGWYLIQEEIAMTAVCALDPQPGETILDLCAAPGNKTVQLALRMADTGMVVANEWNAGRLSSLWSAIARMGVLNVATVNEDGRTISLPNYTFDRVLADVPCSGEGTLRKHPNRDWSVARTLKAIARLVPIQKQLLNRTLDLVKPGGVVVYSTCTFAPEENEAVLDAVMGDRAVVEPFPIDGLHHQPGVTRWQGMTFRSDLTHAHRYFPHVNDTGGFFVARLRRTDAPSASSSLGERQTFHASEEMIPYGEREAELAAWGDRFGIEDRAIASLRLWQKGTGKFWLAHQDCDPSSASLASVPVQTLGIPLFRSGSHVLKPSTAALQRFGSAITRHVITLETPEQVHQFLSGQAQALPPELAAMADEGYLHVRSDLYELGCGLLKRGILHSQLPKALRF